MSQRLQRIMELVGLYQDLPPDRILLGKGIDLDSDDRRIVATQLSLRQTLGDKLPSWKQAGVYVPSQLNLEQCSSEATACLKSEIFTQPNDCILDLTGGMGVDYWALSRRARRGIYVEQSYALVEAMTFNAHQLSADVNHQFVCAEALEVLEPLFLSVRPDLIYLDPARREAQTTSARRVYAIEDCSPSLDEVHSRLKALTKKSRHYPRLVVKLSPMLDIKHTLRLYPDIRAVYIVALKGEVKELLLLFDYSAHSSLDIDDIEIHAIDITPLGERRFCSTYGNEERLSSSYASSVEAYVYELNGALMKSGLFNSLAEQYGLQQLHPNSHLYTSPDRICDFPGRSFSFIEAYPSNSSALKRLGKELGKAEVSTRNYPLSTESLRQKLGVKSGGTYTLMGTTLLDGSHTMLILKKL